MGKKNSSKTRVDPVFRSLYKKDAADTPWLPRLLKLPIGGHAQDLPPKTDYTIKEMYWEPMRRSCSLLWHFSPGSFATQESPVMAPQ